MYKFVQLKLYLRLSTTHILKTKYEFKRFSLNMSTHKRPSDGLHCSSPSKINCVKSQIHKSSIKSESILAENTMNSVEVMESPEKSGSDKKSYRVIRLSNELKALLISDPTQSPVVQDLISNQIQKNEESDEELDEEKPRIGEPEQMTSTDDEEDSQSEASDDESNKCAREKRGKLAACALCVDVGSFSDPRDVQGLAHFLGKTSLHFNSNFFFVFSKILI